MHRGKDDFTNMHKHGGKKNYIKQAPNEKISILLSQLYIKCKIRVTYRNSEYNNNIWAESGTI